MSQLDWNKYRVNNNRINQKPSVKYPREKEALELAKSGRLGDTMIMHVNPKEVDFLSDIGIITTNPETGQPEAILGMLLGGIGSLLMGGIGAIGGLLGSVASGIAGIFAPGAVGATGIAATAPAAAATAAPALAAAAPGLAGATGMTAAELAAANAAAATATGTGVLMPGATALQSSGAVLGGPGTLGLNVANPAFNPAVGQTLLAGGQAPGMIPGAGMIHPELLAAQQMPLNTGSMLAQTGQQMTPEMFTALENAKAAQQVGHVPLNTGELSAQHLANLRNNPNFLRGFGSGVGEHSAALAPPPGGPAVSGTQLPFNPAVDTSGTQLPFNPPVDMTPTNFGPPVDMTPTNFGPPVEPSGSIAPPESFSFTNPSDAAFRIEPSGMEEAFANTNELIASELPEKGIMDWIRNNKLTAAGLGYAGVSSLIGDDVESIDREPYVNTFDEKGLKYSPSWRESPTARRSRAMAMTPGGSPLRRIKRRSRGIA